MKYATKAVINHLEQSSVSGQWPVQASVSRLIIVIGMRRGMRSVGEAGSVYTTHSPRHVICHSLIANTMQSHKLPVKVESSHVNILLFCQSIILFLFIAA